VIIVIWLFGFLQEGTSYTYIISGKKAITWTATHGWRVCWKDQILLQCWGCSNSVKSKKCTVNSLSQFSFSCFILSSFDMMNTSFKLALSVYLRMLQPFMRSDGKYSCNNNNICWPANNLSNLVTAPAFMSRK